MESTIKSNINSWAIRMGVEINVDTAYRLLSKSMPGSILRGPLTIVFFKYLEKTIADAGHRLAIATMAAEVVAKRIRDNSQTATLTLAAAVVNRVGEDSYRVAFARYASVIGVIVDAAISACVTKKPHLGGQTGGIIARHVLQQRYY